jgi:hypothetical protein
MEVGCVIPEPDDPFMEGLAPLFLHASEVIQSKCDTLQFRVFIKVMEIHDFTLADFSDDEFLESSSDSGTDGLPSS